MAALVVYIISIMAAAIISILYSYFFYKKKLATGEGLKIQYNTKKCDISDHRNFRYCVYYMDVCFGEAFRFVVMIVILTLKQKDGMIIQGVFAN